MGSGTWSTDVYSAASVYRARTNSPTFAFDHASRTRSRSSWTPHPDLDPKGATRQARDSAEHPASVPVSVLFDVTGSMGSVPRTLQTKLPDLFGLLLKKGYATDPQVMFGAIGDATCDRVPLQVGQFESDNRADTDLEKLLFEGGGGGQMTESYELAMYFMARHVELDATRRGRRGYLFIIGDEMCYPKVNPAQVERFIGDHLEASIPTPAIVTELKERFDTYFILPAGASYAGSTEVLTHWKGLLGQNVIELDDLDAVAETIALSVGLGEGTVDIAQGLGDLVSIGSTSHGAVGRALARRGSGRLASTSAPLDLGGPSDLARL